MTVLAFPRRLWRRLRAGARRRADLKRPTWAESAPAQALASYFRVPPANLIEAHAEALSAVSARYLEHRFDLLGSGWVRPAHGVACRGLEGCRFEMAGTVEADPGGAWLAGRVNAANLDHARAVWQMIDGPYQPIDWQIDFKSGYRWFESCWYRDIEYGTVRGVDVKVPWELARMQHLPQLALASVLADRGLPGFAAAAAFRREFRNQVLDFIATNPPRFGVNWSCTMDVAIRLANWLVARDLFVAAGAVFDRAFETEFRRAVLDHGRHIAANLEWSAKLRANHYLADVAGLVFAGAYLPRSGETDAWLALGVQELVREVGLQFGPDGGGFEASTAYHRLSAEIAVYATAVVLGLPESRLEALADYDAGRFPQEPALQAPPLAMHDLPGGGRSPFPLWYVQRLRRAAEFSARIAKPSGRVPQIGDNDSGRFLKPVPHGRPRTVAEARELFHNLDGFAELPDDAVHWQEEHCRHGDLVAALNGLFGGSGGGGVEQWLVGAAAGGQRFAEPAVDAAADFRRGEAADWERLLAEAAAVPEERRAFAALPVGEGLADGLELHGFPDFGLFVFRSGRLYLALRCGPVGQNGNGGHAHNDQLAVELTVDGVDLIEDPGSYLYTPLPDRRNAYRSVASHFVPRVGAGEPSGLDQGLFTLAGDPAAECLYFGPHGCAGRYRHGRAWVNRAVAITGDAVEITDWVEAPLTLGPATGAEPVALSPGYGLLRRDRLSWTLTADAGP